MNYKKEFIEFMVRSGVLTFGDFVTKSGRKTAYFINTGNYKTGMQAKILGSFYARCIVDNINSGRMDKNVNVLFGPAYKGIPLAVATSIALASEYDMDVNYCFNRKEAKDHGEGGSMVGHRLKDGDRVLIIEDVVTAGTAVRETMPILKAQADVQVEGLVISVDRMEKGQRDKTAIEEINDEFGIAAYPIVTVREIIDALYNVPVDGKIIVDDEIRSKMEAGIIGE